MNTAPTKRGPESGAALDARMFDGRAFWRNVDFQMHDRNWKDACWLWQGGRKSSGYGSFYANSRNHAAHRVSYVLEVGPIEPGMTVRHRCDNPPCVNPRHLVVGTQAENVRDREERSRRAAPSGVENGHAKLDEDTVREIVRAVALGESQVAVARRLAVEKSTVGKIVRGQSWRHVERPKPWRDAKAGEVWVLEVSSIGQAAYLAGDFTFLAADHGMPIDSERITAGRRIWPEVAS